MQTGAPSPAAEVGSCLLQKLPLAEQELPFQKVMHLSSSERPAANEPCWLTAGFVKLLPCLRQHQLWYNSSFRAPYGIKVQSTPLLGSSPVPSTSFHCLFFLRAPSKEISHIPFLSSTSRESDLWHYPTHARTHARTHHTHVPEIKFQK